MVWKPAGPTSRRCLEEAQRRVGVWPLGHTGTLDPLACGLLLLLGGEARKFQELLTDHDKEYEARVVIGMGSHSEDSEGPLWCSIPRQAPPSLTAIETVLRTLEGDQDQVPPRLSAIRVAGRRSHDRARSGEEFELAPRRVRIYRIEVISWAAPVLRLRVACGSGTYIRSLARDVGDRLGTAAFLSGLRRTRLGSLVERDAVALSNLTPQRWVSLEDLLRRLPRVDVDLESARRLRHGQRVPVERGPESGRAVLWCHEKVVGLVEMRGRVVFPRRMLQSDANTPVDRAGTKSDAE